MMSSLSSLIVIVGALVANTVAAQSDGIRGSGSSFAAGAYTSWGFSYSKEKHVSVTYQATGSGDGLKQIIARSVDFGASDYALAPDELKKYDLLQFPTLVSGIVPVVNVPGVKPGQLKLTASVLAGIFSGRILNWSDREIQTVNPSLTLPNLAITRIVRSDASGTTAGFTEYLGKVDPDWSKQIGSGPQVKWPKGTESVRGNDGVAGAVQSGSGTIGYVAANTVHQSKLCYVLLQNRNKQFTAPTQEAFVAAIKSTAALNPDDKISFVDAPGPGAWPLTDATYVLVERAPKNPQQVSRVLNFFYWAFLRGDLMASETGYVPLPATIQARAIGAFRQVRDTQDNPLNFMSSARINELARAASYPGAYPIESDWNNEPKTFSSAPT
jgi:phosphate transport system substrate-binding protein